MHLIEKKKLIYRKYETIKYKRLTAQSRRINSLQQTGPYLGFSVWKDNSAHLYRSLSNTDRVSRLPLRSIRKQTILMLFVLNCHQTQTLRQEKNVQFSWRGLQSSAMYGSDRYSLGDKKLVGIIVICPELIFHSL